ncbi:MAG: DUF2817 domain-containing protein, partial [Eudoraea sp.]|nr:DUF2817 domain-containing protein [Eudoraea sp.]
MFTNVTNLITFVIDFAFTFAIQFKSIVNFSTLKYQDIKEPSVHGRYISSAQLHSFINSNTIKKKISLIGKSVESRPIHKVTLGSGNTNILIWSQMHGNETTTTKAVLDLINYLNKNSDLASQILSSVTLTIVPVLNPDGAVAYTRVNANNIDLNRDALELSQPESKVLRDLYDEIKPDYCFNLHDQRTIYNVGSYQKPATISFLAPAHDIDRKISASRAESMKIIVAMYKALSTLLPDQIGRYHDAFNPNCIGDTLQMLGTPTILFEAGHYPEDYEREKTREFIFYALIKALSVIAGNKIQEYNLDDYFDIPENSKQYFDLLLINAHLINNKYDENIGILYKEVLDEEAIIFDPYIEA